MNTEDVRAITATPAASTEKTAQSATNALEVRPTLVAENGPEVRRYRAMQDTRRTVGNNIRLARRLNGNMTQGELARRLEIPARQLSDWERGIHKPGDKNLHRIALALGQPFHWFFIEHDENGNHVPEAVMA